jgi:hypothetical protein
MAGMIIVPKLERISVQQDGNQVLLVKDGTLLVRLPWEAAQVLAKAIQIQAGKAEEIARAEQIIFDDAILLRAGAPVGLSSNPIILDQAAKEAAWNSKLRRYMPGGIKSKEKFGTPRIIRHRPRKAGENG